MGHCRLRHLLIRKKRVARSKLGVPRHKNRRQHRGLDPLVVVWVDAHILLLRSERELANVKSLELMVGLEVRPTPNPAVDHMGKPFPVRHLQTSIKATRYGDALAWLTRTAECLLQSLDCSL